MLLAVAKRFSRHGRRSHGKQHRTMLCSMPTELETMKATIAIDDELFAQAQEYAGVEEKSAVISEALKAYVQREAARRLARLGGTEPQLRPIPRRRSR
jgi:Arc/MetJ family transcription regulator